MSRSLTKEPMAKEPTMRDVMKMLKGLDERFEHFEQNIGEMIQDLATHMDVRLDRVEQDTSVLKTDMSVMKKDMIRVSSSMVTKDHFDDKVADLRADLVMLARKGNTKFSALVEQLLEQRVLDQNTARRLLAFEPFPQN